MDNKRVCKDHPDQLAEWECEVCHSYQCSGCVKRKEVSSLSFHVCKFCGGRCLESLKKDVLFDSLSAAGSFFDSLLTPFAIFLDKPDGLDDYPNDSECNQYCQFGVAWKLHTADNYRGASQ